MLMSFSPTRDLDIVFEELPPWNSHFCKCLCSTKKQNILNKQHKNKNLRTQNNENLAFWFLLEKVSVVYESF